MVVGCGGMRCGGVVGEFEWVLVRWISGVGGGGRGWKGLKSVLGGFEGDLVSREGVDAWR